MKSNWLKRIKKQSPNINPEQTDKNSQDFTGDQNQLQNPLQNNENKNYIQEIKPQKNISFDKKYENEYIQNQQQASNPNIIAFSNQNIDSTNLHLLSDRTSVINTNRQLLEQDNDQDIKFNDNSYINNNNSIINQDEQKSKQNNYSNLQETKPLSVVMESQNLNTQEEQKKVKPTCLKKEKSKKNSKVLSFKQPDGKMEKIMIHQTSDVGQKSTIAQQGEETHRNVDFLLNPQQHEESIIIETQNDGQTDNKFADNNSDKFQSAFYVKSPDQVSDDKNNEEKSIISFDQINKNLQKQRRSQQIVIRNQQLTNKSPFIRSISKIGEIQFIPMRLNRKERFQKCVKLLKDKGSSLAKDKNLDWMVDSKIQKILQAIQIEPNSEYKISWDVLVTILNILCVFVVSIQTCFNPQYNIMRTEVTKYFTYLSLVIFMVDMMFGFSTASCGFYGLGKFQLTVMQKKECWINTENTLVEGHLEDQTWENQYISTFFVISSLLMGEGLYVMPTSTIEQVYIIVLELFTCISIAYIINMMGNFLNAMNRAKKQFYSDMAVMDSYMKKKQIPFELQLRTRNYLEYQFLQQNEMTTPQEEEILQYLPENLHQEIMKISQRKIIKLLFANFNFSEELIEKAAIHLKELKFSDKEIVSQNNNYQQIGLYFLQTGELDIYKNYRKGACIQKNTTFGHVEFISGITSPYQIKSNGITLIYYLNRLEFMNLLKGYQKDHEQLLMLKDQISFTDNKYKLNQFCIICQERNHFFTHCDGVHYNPNKQQVIKDFRKQDEVLRVTPYYRVQTKHNSRSCIDKIQLIAYEAHKNHLFTDYFRMYPIVPQDYEQYLTNSQKILLNIAESDESSYNSSSSQYSGSNSNSFSGSESDSEGSSDNSSITLKESQSVNSQYLKQQEKNKQSQSYLDSQDIGESMKENIKKSQQYQQYKIVEELINEQKNLVTDKQKQEKQQDIYNHKMEQQQLEQDQDQGFMQQLNLAIKKQQKEYEKQNQQKLQSQKKKEISLFLDINKSDGSEQYQSELDETSNIKFNDNEDQQQKENQNKNNSQQFQKIYEYPQIKSVDKINIKDIIKRRGGQFQNDMEQSMKQQEQKLLQKLQNNKNQQSDGFLSDHLRKMFVQKNSNQSMNSKSSHQSKKKQKKRKNTLKQGRSKELQSTSPSKKKTNWGKLIQEHLANNIDKTLQKTSHSNGNLQVLNSPSDQKVRNNSIQNNSEILKNQSINNHNTLHNPRLRSSSKKQTAYSKLVKQMAQQKVKSELFFEESQNSAVSPIYNDQERPNITQILKQEIQKIKNQAKNKNYMQEKRSSQGNLQKYPAQQKIRTNLTNNSNFFQMQYQPSNPIFFGNQSNQRQEFYYKNFQQNPYKGQQQLQSIQSFSQDQDSFNNTTTNFNGYDNINNNNEQIYQNNQYLQQQQNYNDYNQQYKIGTQQRLSLDNNFNQVIQNNYSNSNNNNQMDQNNQQNNLLHLNSNENIKNLIQSEMFQLFTNPQFAQSAKNKIMNSSQNQNKKIDDLQQNEEKDLIIKEENMIMIIDLDMMKVYDFYFSTSNYYDAVQNYNIKINQNLKLLKKKIKASNFKKQLQMGQSRKSGNGKKGRQLMGFSTQRKSIRKSINNANFFTLSRQSLQLAYKRRSDTNNNTINQGNL